MEVEKHKQRVKKSNLKKNRFSLGYSLENLHMVRKR